MEQARRIFQRSDGINRKMSLWMWQIGASLVLDSLLDGEPTYSGEIALQVRQLQESGANIPMVLKARLSLRQGKPEEALAELEQALDELQGKAALNTVRIYALQALAYQAQGKSEQSLTALQQALALGEPENRVMAFVREGAEMERLLHMAQAKGVRSEFVRRLLAVFASRRKPEPAPAMPTGELPEPLSRREQDVLKLLAQGRADKQIAEILVLSRGTVHKHLRNIYEKLNVHSRTEAIARGRELHLL
jgi:LuxR family maltose regulon positive regulatory protein